MTFEGAPVTIQENPNASQANSLKSYFAAAKILLDSQLEKLHPIIAELKLQKQIEYVMQTQGKRLRSATLLLSGESVGGKREELAKLALAIELLHSATLVHDDVLDGDVFRRNALSVHAKWSVKEAILVGDALASLSLRLCRGYRTEILDVMADTCLQLSDGEYMDIELTNLNLSEENYLVKTKKKSGSLFKAAAECGALAGKGSPGEISALSSFGENYGIAFQIRDDIADVDSVKNEIPPDINELRATLPMIYLSRCGSTEIGELLKKWESVKTKQILDNSVFHELHVELRNSGALSYCANRIDEFVINAIVSLDGLKDSPFKNYLIAMAQSCRFSGC